MKSDSLELGSLELDDLEVDDLEADDGFGRILSPAQRSARCVMTLFCVLMVAATAFHASRMGDRVDREMSSISSTSSVSASPATVERQDTAREKERGGLG
ncbi:MAG: hypothetical protein LBI87_03440 [Candidatus Accumulibacter sp.]|jgi:hypothetical protein|nr:hypothetical protein [Accumulibacter sp.]